LTTARYDFWDEPIDRSDSIRNPFACRLDKRKYGENHEKITFVINYLSPPYFFRAVRSFGEYGAERDKIRPHVQSDSQELFAKKPANTGDFLRSNFGERDLPKG
jgi:hypothetical protein